MRTITAALRAFVAWNRSRRARSRAQWEGADASDGDACPYSAYTDPALRQAWREGYKSRETRAFLIEI